MFHCFAKIYSIALGVMQGMSFGSLYHCFAKMRTGTGRCDVWGCFAKVRIGTRLHYAIN